MTDWPAEGAPRVLVNAANDVRSHGYMGPYRKGVVSGLYRAFGFKNSPPWYAERAARIWWKGVELGEKRGALLRAQSAAWRETLGFTNALPVTYERVMRRYADLTSALPRSSWHDMPTLNAARDAALAELDAPT